MNSFFTTDAFRYLCLPIGSAVLAAWVKWIGSGKPWKTTGSKFGREDLAVGIDLMLAGTVTFAGVTASNAARISSLTTKLDRIELSESLTSAPWILFLMICGVFFVSFLSGCFRGPQRRLHSLFGLYGPLVCGLSYLWVVMKAV